MPELVGTYLFVILEFLLVVRAHAHQRRKHHALAAFYLLLMVFIGGATILRRATDGLNHGIFQGGAWDFIVGFLADSTTFAVMGLLLLIVMGWVIYLEDFRLVVREMLRQVENARKKKEIRVRVTNDGHRHQPDKGRQSRWN
jgi:hypothetical protein